MTKARLHFLVSGSSVLQELEKRNCSHHQTFVSSDVQVLGGHAVGHWVSEYLIDAVRLVIAELRKGLVYIASVS